MGALCRRMPPTRAACISASVAKGCSYRSASRVFALRGRLSAAVHKECATSVVRICHRESDVHAIRGYQSGISVRNYTCISAGGNARDARGIAALHRRVRNRAQASAAEQAQIGIEDAYLEIVGSAQTWVGADQCLKMSQIAARSAGSAAQQRRQRNI